MTGASYEIVERAPEALTIRYVRPWDQYPTLASAAEGVIEELTRGGILRPGQRLFYYEGAGELNEILHEDGKFIRFAPRPERGRAMRLDEKGRCCGRKPMLYKGKWPMPGWKYPLLFCPRCGKHYDPETGQEMTRGIVMAHLRNIAMPKCQTCGRKATKELYNRYNAPIGYYCSPCSARALSEAKKTEETANHAENHHSNQ